METSIIHCCDNVEGLSNHVDNNSIDLTLTSPPYDDLRENSDYRILPMAKFEKLVCELYRVTTEGGVMVWVVGDQTIDGDETGTSFKQALRFKEAGFKLLDTMIYEKTSYPPNFPGMKRYEQTFEYMFVFTKGKLKTFNPIKVDKKKNSVYDRTSVSWFRQPDGSMSAARKIDTTSDKKLRENVWSYSTGYNQSTKDKIAYDHPAIFPEELAKDHIKSWTNEGDVVLDPFMGSGTTAKMAEVLGRKWVGFELSQEYIDIAYTRLGKVDQEYYEELPAEKKPKQEQLF